MMPHIPFRRRLRSMLLICVSLAILLALAVLTFALLPAAEQQVTPTAWRVPIVTLVHTPTPPGGWWSDLPTPAPVGQTPIPRR